MIRCMGLLSFTSTAGLLFAIISRADASEWILFLGAVGASILSWGIGAYHQYRSTRRKEDHEDRESMISDVREHTKILVEMESRQTELKKDLEKLILHVERIRDNYPGETGRVKYEVTDDGQT